MKILFFVPHPIESPGPRFCVYQYLKSFEDAGIECAVSSFLTSNEYKHIYNNNVSPFRKVIILLTAFFKGTLKQLFMIFGVKQYDAVIVYRETMPWGKAWLERYIFKRNIPLIHVFDDAIWMPVKSQIGISPIVKKYLKSEHKFDEISRIADHVIVVNSYLASHVRLLNDHVSVIPIVISEHYLNATLNKKKNENVVIGWMGSGSTAPYLHLLDTIWEKLPQNCVLRIVGGDYMPKGIKTTNIKWSLETELDEFAMFDIGIVPMPDNDWVKGKGGGKTLQYMSLNIPTIGSSVGINLELIQNGINGFLAKDEKDWIEKLTLMIKNPSLREKLGSAGRRTVEEQYTLKVWAPKYMEIINKIVQTRDKS